MHVTTIHANTFVLLRHAEFLSDTRDMLACNLIGLLQLGLVQIAEHNYKNV